MSSYSNIMILKSDPSGWDYRVTITNPTISITFREYLTDLKQEFFTTANGKCRVFYIYHSDEVMTYLNLIIEKRYD